MAVGSIWLQGGKGREARLVLLVTVAGFRGNVSRKRLEYFFMNKSQGEMKKALPHVSRIVFPAQHLHRWGFKMRFQTSVRGSFLIFAPRAEITCFKRAT
jgi:hypothetical protein